MREWKTTDLELCFWWFCHYKTVCPKPIHYKFNKSIIQKQRNKHNKIVLLAKTKLNSKDAWHSRDLINSYIRHNEFVSVNNVLRESTDMKQATKNLKTSTVHQKF